MGNDENNADNSPQTQKLKADYAADNNGAGLPPLGALEGYIDAVYALKTAIETLGLTGDPAKLTVERATLAAWLYNAPNLPGFQPNSDYYYLNGVKVAPLYLCQVTATPGVYTLVTQISNPIVAP